MSKYCCEDMSRNIEFRCDTHDNPFDCPDNLVYYCEQWDEYGLIIHDGGESYILISYCPWCGSKLPDSKRDLWFYKLEKLGFDNPFSQSIPVEFESDEWYQKKV